MSTALPRLWTVSLLTDTCLVTNTAHRKLGLSLAGTHRNVSLVWPPTGIALIALLLFGYRLWPGIALGAFLINASTDVGLATAGGIGLGNTLEALSGAYLLQRFARFRHSLERVQDVLGLVTLGAGLSTTVSATIGVTSLCLGGAAPWALYGSLWWQWWLGDAMGTLVVAPVLLTWTNRPWVRWRSRQLAEAVAVLGLLVLVSPVVFGLFTTRITHFPFAFAIFPFVIWTALRFSPREAATATLVASGIAIWGTTRELGPFAARTLTESLLVLQTFMSVVAVTGLVLAAAITQRRRGEERFRLAIEAAPNAMIGVDTQGAIVLVNAQTEALFGYARAELLGLGIDRLVPERFRGRHREYRDAFLAHARTRAMGAGRDLLALRKDGSEIPVEIGLNPIGTDDGMIVLAAIIDITERKQFERALREAEALRAVTALATAAAHEINNPLEVIQGHLQLLAEKLATPGMRRHIDAPIRAVEKIHEIVGRMRRITRLSLADASPALPDMLDLERSSERSEDQICKPEQPKQGRS